MKQLLVFFICVFMLFSCANTENDVSVSDNMDTQEQIEAEPDFEVVTIKDREELEEFFADTLFDKNNLDVN